MSTVPSGEAARSPRRVHDEFAHVYDLARPIPPLLQAAICSQVSELVSMSAPRLLDVGTGTGVIRWLDGDHGDIVRLDHSHRMLTQRHGDGHRVCSDAGSLPFADSCFDAVVSRHVLEAIKSRTTVVSEMRRVLKAGAPYLHAISTPPEYAREIHTYWRQMTNLVRVANDQQHGYESPRGDIQLDLVGTGASISFATSFTTPVSQTLSDVLVGYARKAYPSCWELLPEAHRACLTDLEDWARNRFPTSLLGQFQSSMFAVRW